METLPEHEIYWKYHERGGNPTRKGSISNISKTKQ